MRFRIKLTIAVMGHTRRLCRFARSRGFRARAQPRYKYRQTLDPYRDCPERRGVGWTGGGVGAVSIGSFELSRWRGGRGGLWDFNASVLIAGGLKQPTETKKDMMLFLKTALES